ncbi:LysM peptidoglycan-binding domain-containing protein [Lacrimispora sp. JR3]|uniref:LysM peptidoglycan-binding domain-containing protein n=1 Tax=Lacrimispora sinapis TaxID=3111456 RepID=UPI003747C9D7
MIRHLIVLLLITLLGSRAFGSFPVKNSAAAFDAEAIERYYTSIQIRQGDSLWSIAGKYKGNSGLTVEQYVKELKNINGLKEDTIHSGHYLTVMYFTPEQAP